MSFLRSSLAAALLAAAMAAALLGVGSQWLDRIARSPEPMREFVGAVSRDDEVIVAIAAEVESAAFDAIPDLADYVPGLRDQLEALMRQGVDAALSDEELTAAWFTAVDETRAEAVAGLDVMREQHGSPPLVSFTLRPFIELGEAKLYQLSDPGLHPYLDALNLQRNVEVPLGVLPAQPAHWAAEALGVAAQWRWHYGAALALALVGLLVGSRRGRWLALLGAVGFGVAVQMLAKGLVAGVSVPGGSGVAATLRARILAGAGESLVATLDRSLMVSVAILVVGGVALSATLIVNRRRRRAGG